MPFALQLVGAVVLAVALFLVWVPLGLAIVGVGVFGVGVLLERREVTDGSSSSPPQ